MTFEVSDDAGNSIGFADYSTKPELARSPQSIPSIKAIAEDYADRVWNKKDLSAIDDYLDKAVVIHSLLGDYHGIEAMKEVVRAWLKAFPDLIVSNIAEIKVKMTQSSSIGRRMELIKASSKEELPQVRRSPMPV